MSSGGKTDGSPFKGSKSKVEKKGMTITTQSEKERIWFWVLVGAFVVGFIFSLLFVVSSEYVPINKKIVYDNNSDIQAIIIIDDNLGVPPPGYTEHKKSTVSAALYFKKVPTYIKDVKLSSDTKSIMTVKNGTMDLDPNKHPVNERTPANMLRAKALNYVGDVEVGHSLQAKNFTEMYNIDIFYRTNANDTGPLLRMNIKFPWSITTLDFGDLTYFWIIFAGVVLSRVFTFSTSSETGKASKMTTQLKNLELIWVPFSAVITLLIFSSFHEQTKLGPNIISNIALAFGFGFGFDKIFETWAKSPTRGEESTKP
jgi:hypothetical protein